jgi:hypothetical protein
MIRDENDNLVRRHFLAGWWLLLVFVAMGTTLEAFHGLKAGFYLDLGNATRRLMWTLAHAHGVLLGLVNIAFAVTLQSRGMRADKARITSASLLGASALLPGGFLLGGIVVYGGDPSLGVLLTPVGAVLLLVAALFVVRSMRASEPTEKPARQPKRR